MIILERNFFIHIMWQSVQKNTPYNLKNYIIMTETQTLNAILEELVKINKNLRQHDASNTTHFSIEQLSEAMSCHPNTIRTWIKEGNLPTFQYKGTIRIRANQLERFITKYTG